MRQMAATKVAIIYYSATGHTHKLAEAIAAGAKEAGAEVRARLVQELAPESAIEQNPAWKAFYDQTKGDPRAALADLEWADGIILGSPTRFGLISAQLKQFIDTTGGLWFQGKLANKAVAGFTAASNAHGGQEATILSLYHVFYHWGAIVAAPGYTDQVIFGAGGNPYGSSCTNQPDEAVLAGARHMGKRVAMVAGWINAGLGR
jgi:NAD(P)H dehydrogenase (quinone)